MPGGDTGLLAVGPAVIRELEAIIAIRGKPAMIVLDNVLSGESRIGR